jgi:hydroxyacylglutathione hydrolase
MTEDVSYPLSIVALHPLRIAFTVPAPSGPLPRFVNVYLISVSGSITLIDTGVAGSENAIFEHICRNGMDPGNIGTIVLTHAHPDHVGSAKTIRERTGCTIAAHADDLGWIEDTGRQARERPVPGFSVLVAGAVTVDWVLKEGDVIELDEGRSLTVIHTPGHSPGSIALLLKPEMVLFSGDAVPVPGDLPIYDDPVKVIASISRLKAIERIMMLYSSWDDPRESRAAYRAMEDGIAWVRLIQETVEDVVAKRPSLEAPDLTRTVLKKIGIPEDQANPMVIRTVLGHLKRR